MGIRFLLHPLPSREFCPRYLGLTRNIRPFLDFVGFTLLYRLVVCSLLDVVFSAVGLAFTRLDNHLISRLPTYLLVEVSQPYLTSCGVTQFNDNSLLFIMRELPLAPDQLGLLALATFVPCIPLLSLPTRAWAESVTLLREGSGCESTRGVGSPYQTTISGRADESHLV